jgi:phosphate uptake regulator
MLQRFMDSMRNTDERQRDFSPMKDYVNDMLKDLKVAYREREDQLSEVAQNYKRRLDTVAHKHQQLIVAYRYVNYSCCFV